MNKPLIYVEWRDYDKAADALIQSVRARVVPFVLSTFRSFAETGLEMVEERTPLTRPGRTNIRSLWKLDEFSVTPEVQSFVIRNLYKDTGKTNVILWFEEGTLPHDIPVGKFGFLHFTTYEGDEVYTKKTVKHPGTKAHHMVSLTRKALDAALMSYAEQTAKKVEQMIREI
jgi:hypothetical protein